MSQTERQDELTVQHDTDVRPPDRYRVLMLNDDYTTMDFVVEVLQVVFYKSPSAATAIMLAIHKKGVGICGEYARELAESKIQKVHDRARTEGFPLRCTIERV